MERNGDITWHAVPADEALSSLDTSTNGLSGSEAQRRLEIYGPNVLAEMKKVSPFLRFLEQFKSPLIYILLIASAISFALGELIDAQVILVIVLFNAIIGFVQEYKAERALEALKQMAAPTAQVVRDGVEIEVRSEDIVPGDILLLEAGDRVAADARILEAARVKAEEAALTGESLPVDKHTAPLPPDTPLAERENMVYAGTIVASGRGMAVVTATGPNTQTGRIAREVREAPITDTPIQRKLDQVGRWLGGVGVLIAFILVGMGILRGFGLYELFLTAVAVAVAFIPEGLPALVTVVLAVGVQRMARRKSIIRKLPAVEALGSATVICTDKTGTLTKNEMTAQVCCTSKGMFRITGEGYRPEGRFQLDDTSVDPNEYPGLRCLLLMAALANDSHLVERGDQWAVTGDPTDGALRVAAEKAGLRRVEQAERYPRIDEIPFESEHRYMATLNRPESGPALICAKGAPERILEMCSHILDDGRREPLSDERKQAITETNESLASRAYRVLALAYKEAPRETNSLYPEEVESGLVFLGLIGMIDPARPEASQAVERAKRAGIRVIMITGDNPVTAEAIARSLHILNSGETVTGRELAAMSDDELARRIRHISVFARVEPQHKYRIVEALKANGELVAMTGDGVNDAPALKRADIGVSMGITGTDVARESSDMVLADDNFATIIDAVEEGRVIFINLRKVVQYLLSTNTGEILTFFVAILMGFPLPLLPVQILWVNLVTDGFATAPLAVEPEEGDVLIEPPRDPREPVITRRQIGRIAMVAVIMAVGTLGLFWWELGASGLLKARTEAFATLAIFQLFNVFNVRSPVRSIFQVGILSNPYVLLGVGVSFALQIAVIHVGALQPIFRTTPLTPADWGVVILVSSSVLIVEEIRKLVAPHLFHDRRPSTHETGRRPE